MDPDPAEESQRIAGFAPDPNATGPPARPPVQEEEPRPAGRGLSSGVRAMLGLLMLGPGIVSVLALRITSGEFAVESVGFLAWRVMPVALLAVSVVLAVGWWFWRWPPVVATRTLALAVVCHAVLGFARMPQTYSILIVPAVAWSVVLAMSLWRVCWAGWAPFGWWSVRRYVVYPCPPGRDAAGTMPSAPPTHPPGMDPESAEAIERRFARLRRQLRPHDPQPALPQPSPWFAAAIGVVAGVGSLVLLLPAAPTTSPLYAVEDDSGEQEPLWDQLLLRPQASAGGLSPAVAGTTATLAASAPPAPTDSGGSGDPAPAHVDARRPLLWRPQPRTGGPTAEWETMLSRGSVRVGFSQRSPIVRVEAPGVVAKINPLMELAEMSSDGFPVLRWNRASLSAGSATAWQEWRHAGRSAWVRYSGDPYIQGSWPLASRQGPGPYLGKVAAQLDADAGVAALTSVNHLTVALSARQADLCSMALEPMRGARVIWGGTPELRTILGTGDTVSLSRLGDGTFALRRTSTYDNGNPSSSEDSSTAKMNFADWILVRDSDTGAGFLAWCPLWQRQVSVEKSTHTPIGDPSNAIVVSCAGLETTLRWALLAPREPGGSNVVTLSSGAYLNSLVLVAAAADEPDEAVVARLRDLLARETPPLLQQPSARIGAAP